MARAIVTEFIDKTFMNGFDNRISLKIIYDDFKLWVATHYGFNFKKNEIYALLKGFPNYRCYRYENGLCLENIRYKEPKILNPFPHFKYHINIDPIIKESSIQEEILPESKDQNIGITLNVLTVNNEQLFTFINSSNIDVKQKLISPRIPGVVLPPIANRK
jgi:hypothetical protein